jgi:hypothetical protein
MQLTARVKNSINANRWRENLRGYPNIEGGRSANIFQAESKSEVSSIYVVENWATDLNVSFDPWPMGGNECSFGYFRRFLSGVDSTQHIGSLFGGCPPESGSYH